MPGDVARAEVCLPVPRDGIHLGVHRTVQRHGQRIGGKDLGGLCKRRVSQMQKVELPGLLFHLVICMIYRRDLHHFPFRDIGPTQDSRESLLGRVARLLEPHFFVTVPVGFGNGPGTAKNIDRAASITQQKLAIEG